MIFTDLIDPTASWRLCLTLLHSIWIGAALALLAWVVGRRWERYSYWSHCTALILILVALPITYAAMSSPTSTLSQAVGVNVVQPFATNASSPPSGPISNGQPFESSLASPSVLAFCVPWIAAGYFIGVVLMLLRLTRGIYGAARLAKVGQAVNDARLLKIVERLSQQWSLRVSPALRHAEQLVVPKVVGLVKPTILLPTATLTGLSLAELEMIIAHEMAHVRRYDLWVNFVQRLAETVLFFNPALWYVSRQISELREYCCDELACEAVASSATGSPLEGRLRYAEALMHAVELIPNGKNKAACASLAVSGRSPSELRRRVARLFSIRRRLGDCFGRRLGPCVGG